MTDYKFIDGNVTSPLGFTANGVSAGVKAYTNAAAGIADEPIEGVKSGKRDLAMIYCEKQCSAAAIFTKNLVKSDTIYVTQKHLQNGRAQAVIVNSGNANACNPDGYDKAEAMCKLAAVALRVAEDDVIVASTGVIGQALPIEPIQKGVDELKNILSRYGGTNAAEAIMTTDTVKKEWAVQLTLDGKTVTIGGIAKGSGMIHINMGTTLSFVTTDAAISAEMLKSALVEAADVSYNMVSVDGDTSTNDTCLVLANGLAGNAKIVSDGPDYEAFRAGLLAVCTSLARQMARDGEGATALFEMKVVHARTKEDARILARSVVSSSLTKAAIYGHDANWGRILCAMGYSGAEFTPE